MMTRWNLSLRKWLARKWPKPFTSLYSTLDEPAIVPVQAAAYRLVLEKYLQPVDACLDVGFGLGYGLEILAQQAGQLTGIDIDPRVISNGQKLAGCLPNLDTLQKYNGKKIPFDDRDFDVVTCIDVLEHVPNYLGLLNEMIRVSRRTVFISTPNRRPENTLPNGKPRNPWHLREWTSSELEAIINQIAGVQAEWNFLDGPWEGPFTIVSQPGSDTQAIIPVLFVEP